MILQGAIGFARNIEPATVFSPETFLLECAMQGDQEAFAKLLKPHLRTIFVSAMAILNDESDAEDAVLDAMLKAFRTVAQFPKTAKFSTWLIRMVIDEAR